MFKGSLKTIVSIVLAVAMLAVAVPLVASVVDMPPEDVKAQVEAIERQSEKFERAIRLMEAHMSVNDEGILVLDVEKGADLGIDEETFNTLKESMNKTNARLRAGDVKLSDIHFGVRAPVKEQ